MTIHEPVQKATATQLYRSAYGYFDSENHDYVITNPLTPRPWVNVLANETYGLVISQSGGGFSWAQNCQLYRLTRWEQDLAIDGHGRWAYLADTESGEVWSTTVNPDREICDDVIRHGIGYSTFERTKNGIHSKQTVFVPEEGNFEVWTIEVTNRSERTRSLRFGTYLEWQLGSIGEWHREFWRLFISTEAKGNTLLAWKRRGLHEGTREEPEAPLVGYVSVDGVESATWFADKAAYVGRAGRIHRPEALLGDEAAEVTGRWDDPIAGLRSTLVLGANETRTIVIKIGFADTAEQASADAGVIGAKWASELLDQRTQSLKDKYGCLNVQTDVPFFDLLVNSWLPNQTQVGRILARCAYYQQGGAFGYRDQLQDSLLFLDSDPSVTLVQLERHANAMFQDGGVMHWWHPGTTSGVESHHSDTCMWLSFGVLAYIEETGDVSILTRQHGFLERGTRKVVEQGTMLEHCMRGLNRILSKRSERGLPLLGAGDWNDGLSHAGLDGKGESVWDAMFLYSILVRFADLLDSLGKQGEANQFRSDAKSLVKAIEDHGWDGEWYIAGTDDTGRPFGSKTRPEGSIFLNPQTWASITDFGDESRRKTALAKVKEVLVKPYGALLLNPAYCNVDPYVGYITRYAPGLRENGGVYSHASTWAIEAFARVGDIDTMWAVFKGMCPPLRAEEDADRYAAEPYVTPGNVDGPDSPFEGKAGWTWYTGSSAWLRRTALRWILGVRGTDTGLLIDPKLPSEIPGYSLVRDYRGDRFEIQVEGHGPYQMTVDGTAHEGPIAASGKGQRRTVRLTTN